MTRIGSHVAAFSRTALAAPTLALTAALALTALAPHGGLSAQPGNRPYAASAHGGNYMHNFYFPPAPSSSPWYPEWHPGGERVAVAMSGSLWEVDVATGDAFESARRRLLLLPNYSPDGAWLLYTADDGGGTIDLEVMNTATGSAPLTEAQSTDPRFRPPRPHRLRLDARGTSNITSAPRTAPGRDPI